MVKITTIPKGTRSRLSMGQSDLHDYTIQGDFKAGKLNNKVPGPRSHRPGLHVLRGSSRQSDADSELAVAR
jgi:hypothetical protein